VESHCKVLASAKPRSASGSLLNAELHTAALMAAESCRIMLWQQALAAGDQRSAKLLAQTGIKALRQIERAYAALWLLRNKTTPLKSSPFLKWRQEDYRRSKLDFPPEVARVAKAKTYAAE
jgi:hypothetical protein